MAFNFDWLLQSLGRDSSLFLPELVLCGLIVLLLFLRLFPVLDRVHLGWIALVGMLTILSLSLAQWTGCCGMLTPERYPNLAQAQRELADAKQATPPNPESIAAAENQVRLVERRDQAQIELGDAPGPLYEGESQSDVQKRIAAATAALRNAERKLSQASPIYNGLLVYDRLTLFLRLILFGFTALVIWLSLQTGIPDREDSGDFYCLLLGATLGMVLMASANHLLMIYVAVEMASLPSYALAGFLKGRRQSGEAALKYVVYGGGASGVMLYGISLLAGKFGTAYLPDLAVGFVTAMNPTGTGVVFDPVLVLGALFILIGVAFKLAAVPFHFWCPDVFEGASAEVAGFLSVASKAAALALLARLTLTLAGLEPLVGGAEDVPWSSVIRYLVPTLAVFAAVTATFGNLAAYQQTNLKRLLAYSTIAQAGYMMMGLATLTSEGASAVLFYLVAYLFMNLGAFAVVAFLRNATGSEDLSDFRGLVRRSPWMVVTLSICLLSLLGIPPLVGFMAKLQVFLALYHGGSDYSAQGEQTLAVTLYVLLGIGALNTVLSAVYYVNVMRVMILETRVEDVEGREPVPLPEPAGSVFYATVLSLVLLILGLVANPLITVSQKGAERFVSQKEPR